jgi:transcriptional regulator GlxA family with amidase domain
MRSAWQSFRSRGTRALAIVPGNKKPLPAPERPVGVISLTVDHGDTAILNCQTWLAENYERADIVAELVRRSGLPKRTFDRRFRAATGYSPLAYVQALRIEEAKQLLETGSTSIEAVAQGVGHADMASFRACSDVSQAWRPATTGANSKCRRSSAG